MYYATWLMPAIQVVVSVPEFQTTQAVSKRLNVPLETVQKSLQTLSDIGLVELENGRWRSTHRSLHTPKTSQFVKTYHSNWRLRAMHRAQESIEEGVHYTAVCALAKKDIVRLEQLTQEFIQQTRAVIEPSPEEEVVCMCVDIFKV